MKLKSISLFTLALVAFLTLLYILYPKNEFADRDDVLLRQISFLVNVDICIHDFEKKRSRLPKDMEELIENYPSLLAMRESFEHDVRSVVYLNEDVDRTRVRISNFRPRMDLELGLNGKIVKIP